uniref:Uncharacterized protein n=1 Tax=Glossina pallidipes TaxID=7398 RepID=A0A1A9Z6A3_GLOPL
MLQEDFVGSTRFKCSTRTVACGPSPKVQIDVANVEPGLAPVEGWVDVPTMNLLSVDLVNLVSPNPAVGVKHRDMSRNFVLRKGKELMDSYAKKVRSSTLTTTPSFSGSGPLTVSTTSDTSSTAAS